jgi:predicted metal-binding membrane protein
MTNTRRPERAFIGTVALVFVASAAVTIAWCLSMAEMPGMDMPGGWTMSMAWMRMPGQSWPGAAATFLGMWTVMMVAMMLPVLVPSLWGYRASSHKDARPNLRTVIVAAGYFAPWVLLGVAIYPLGAAFAEAAMRVPGISRVIPLATGIVTSIAGLLQFTAWKARRLACCREARGCHRGLPAGESAWRYGLRLGIQCMHCCLELTAVLIVIGVMDLGVMAIVALATGVERMTPAGERIVGGALVATGLYLTL